jgi:hypothetical protein
MRLDPADIEQIARQVADLIAATQTWPSGQFVDAAELAALLGVERDWFTRTPTPSVRSGSVAHAVACDSTFGVCRTLGLCRSRTKHVGGLDGRARSAYQRRGQG